MRFVLAVIGLLIAAPVFAEDDPAQAFLTEWQGKLLTERHVADSAQALLQAFQKMRQQLDQTTAELDYWHKWCGTTPGCTQPAATE